MAFSAQIVHSIMTFMLYLLSIFKQKIFPALSFQIFVDKTISSAVF